MSMVPILIKENRSVMATKQQQDFCKAVYDAAKKINEISPLFVAAQACLESAWGTRKVGNYNIFGITKGSNWNGKTVLVLTSEVFNVPGKKFYPPEKVVSVTKTAQGRYRYKVYRLFKDFSSYDECLREHLRLFEKPGYADAWPYRRNAYEFAKKIADCKGCKYATDPNYATVMRAMIESVRKIVEE